MKMFLVGSVLLYLIATCQSQAPTEQCVSQEAASRSSEVISACNGVEHIGDFETICNNQACYNVFSEVFAACNFPKEQLQLTCEAYNNNDAFGGLAPTSDQLQCYVDHSRSRAVEVLQKCGNTDLSNAVAICKSGPCLDLMSQIYTECGYTKLASLCRTIGGNSRLVYNDVLPGNMSGSSKILYAVPISIFIGILFSMVF